MPKIIQTTYFKTPYGKLILGSFENKLCLCDWQYRKMRSAIDRRLQAELDAEFKVGKSEIITKTKSQLTEYFNGNREDFDIPLLLIGTDFQKSVWNTLLEIPFGKTDTYLGLSKKLGNIKAIRAVATANGANAISIIIPCHRVIGSNGDLVGYAGGLGAKNDLLKLEGALTKNQLSLF